MDYNKHNKKNQNTKVHKVLRKQLVSRKNLELNSEIVGLLSFGFLLEIGSVNN